jgi:hypothetical protein
MHLPRKLEPWQIIIAAGIILTAGIVLALLAGVGYLLANGVGYVLAHAWWTR